jgi:glutamate-1-semialdehyde 2,1-aminomutase
MTTTTPTTSAELLAEGAKWSPGGCSSSRRNLPGAICPDGGKGAYVHTVDGHRLIDYHADYGPPILGYANDAVDTAVIRAIKSGLVYGSGTTRPQVELARLLTEIIPSFEDVLFTNTGNESSMHCVRVARAFTGRQKLIKFQGSYNGSHDAVLRNIISPADRTNQRDPGSPGMLEAAIDNTIVCRFNDCEGVTAAFAEYGEQLAAVILEPVLHNAPTILPLPGFHQHLRDLCDKYGVVLVWDEVVTAFRHHIGAYQTIAGVTPDLTMIAKSAANGYPFAALGGRREIMQRFSTFRGDDSAPPGDVFYGGTFNGHTLGAVAAIATIRELQKRDYEDLYAKGERMRAGLRRIASTLPISLHVSGEWSIYNLSFLTHDGDFTSYDDVLPNDGELQVRYRRELNDRGVVFEMPEPHGRNHISFAHTFADVERSLDVMDDALRDIARHLH